MPNYTTPKTWNAGDILTAGDLNTYIRDLVEGMMPLGTIIHICQAATSVETLINNCWLECNGAAVSRTTYASLNTLLSGMGYPFGNGNGSTTFNLPDLRGRMFVNHGTSSGHNDVKTLGNSDGGALANRSPAHAHTNGLSVTAGSLAVSSHTHSVTDPGHTHSVGAGGSPTTFFASSSTSISPAASTSGSSTTGITIGSTAPSLTGAPSLSGTIGLSGRLSDSGGYLVAGIHAIKAFT